ncbi:hypothetical protein [Streptomyces sp. Isolate_219]|uniref:hypothetical protein n=1 Tax=Streptomyces sp. Isolate_219 TaxID=2950110 RepID=UPI0021CA9B40|nr:hypothetical protein [Streptomyces sp. Isolate_219]MCR8573592.1 hypothetical protein [Streptomyces sp. Isolate_219]
MTTRTPTSQDLGLGHWDHPLLGRRVVDHAHGDRIGVLRAIAPDSKDNGYNLVVMVPDTPPVAWLSPPAGGREWTTALDAIEAAR